MSSLLLQNFAELTQDPGAADELRRLVLDLAVRGKLVDQDPTDEPAPELLARIKTERARRVAAGELRKSKPLPEITEEEIPFELPEGWVWCRLGEVSFNYDPVRVPLSRKVRAHKKGKYPYYGASGIIDHLDEYLFDGDFLLVGEDGANLVSRSTPLAFVASGKFWVNNHAHVLQFESETLMRYIEIFIEATPLDGYLSGGFQPKLSQGNLNKILIPLPSFYEQRKIILRTNELLRQSEKVHTAASHRQTLTNALIPSLLNGLSEAPDLGVFWREMIVPNFGLFTEQPAYCDQLRRLILDLAVRGRLVAQNEEDEPAEVLLERIKAERERLMKVGKIRKGKPLPKITEEEVPFALPERWIWCRLGEVVSKMGSGSTPRGGKSAYVEAGIPFLRSQNVHDSGLVLSGVSFITAAVHQKMKGTTVYPNDLLLNITGGSIGRCAQAGEEIEEANVSQHVSIIRLIEIYPEYGHLLILSPYIQREIFASVTGAGREGLPKYNQAKFILPLPPLPEQHRIVARVETLLGQVAELRTVAERKVSLRGQVLRAAIG